MGDLFSAFREVKDAQSVLELDISSLTLVPNNQNDKVAYLREACPELHHNKKYNGESRYWIMKILSSPVCVHVHILTLLPLVYKALVFWKLPYRHTTLIIKS